MAMDRATDPNAAFDFEPLNDYLLLRPITPEEVAPETPVSHSAHAQAGWGEVIAIAAPLHVLSPVSIGERVAFRPQSAIAIALAGEWFAMVDAAELLGVAGRRAERAVAPPVAAVSEPEPEVWAEPVAWGREESLETDVAPDLLDSTEATGDDLH
jgi:co-chaperonin GroES (HSP10)